MSPFFSIITPTFNRFDLLASVIESVQDQVYENYEHIIVDDGSTDQTRSLVMGYSAHDDRIRYLNQTNQGRSTARNLGISNSVGSYVCFLDSDDTWNNTYLLELHNAINHKPASFFATKMVWVSLKTGLKNNRPVSSFSRTSLHKIIEQEIGMNVCVKRDLFNGCLFDASLSMNEDYELWMRIVSQNSLDVVAVPLSQYFAKTEEPFGRLDSKSIDGMFNAMRVMRQQSCIIESTSPVFWKNRIRTLRLNKVKALEREKAFWSFSGYAITFALRYPLQKIVPSLLVSVLYGLPGGQLVKSFLKSMKRRIR